MTKQFEHGGRIFIVARQLGIAPEELLDFSASINPLGPPPGVRTAMNTAFDRVGHYPDTSSTELRLALAAHHGFPAERIAVANGSTELIHLIPRMPVFKGKKALLLAPTFSEYAHSLQLSGWSYDYLALSPSSGFALDMEAVRHALGRGYELLFLCNPCNPTGRLYCIEEVEELLALCSRAGTFCVLDEAFMDFCEESSAKGLLAGNDRALILRSMTKFYGFPGIRIGYALGSPATITELEHLRPPWSVGSMAQYAALAALADREHGERTRCLVSTERDSLLRGLAEIPGLKAYPGAANYLLAEIISGITAKELGGRLLKERILIRDCSNFPGLDGRFFRVAVRTADENKKLLHGLAEAFRD